MILSGNAEKLLKRLSTAFRAELTPGNVLGEGAMGVVIAATQVRLARPVAVKFLLCFSDPEALNRFSREAKLASALDHPHIVRLFTVGVDGEIPYLVYEFVDGRTLKDVVGAAGALPPAHALTLARQLMEGLAHAHAKGIVHRDLKPANLLVHADDGLKITDYGIGASLEVESALTRAGTLLGTPAYMAPEQWSSATTVAADVYSAGVIVHEMLTGVNPFVRKTLIATRNAHVHENRPPLPGSLDARLEELVGWMCAKAAPERPSAAECLALLSIIRSRRGPLTRPARSSSPTATPGVPASSGAPSQPKVLVSDAAMVPQQGAGTRPAGALVAVALVIFLAGLIPFLRSPARLANAVTVLAGCRSAVLTLESDAAAEPSATVEPMVTALTVKAADLGARRRFRLTLEGLEPGTAYVVQPLLNGRVAGPKLSLATLGGPEKLAQVESLTYSDARTLRVRFRSPLPLPAALAVSASLPPEWVTGAAGAPREAHAAGLDPALPYDPVLVFDGLPETVPLGHVPGSALVVERTRTKLAGPLGGPAFADRLTLLRRLAAHAVKRAVPAERAREIVEGWVRAITGQSIALVSSAAQTRAADPTLSVPERWRAREVLDGLAVAGAIVHPWCGAWLFEPFAGSRATPKWEWVGSVPRPPEAPAFTQWVPAGPVRQHVSRATLPLWTHRDRPLEASIFMLRDTVADSYAIEPALARAPGWAWLTPPGPRDGAGDVELVLKVYNVLEDHILWLRFASRYTLAVPGPRGAHPNRDVSVATRNRDARGLRITLPAAIFGDSPGVEVRVDGFQATENSPVPDECWIADAWTVNADP